MDNPVKLTTLGKQDEDKQTKNTRQYVFFFQLTMYPTLVFARSFCLTTMTCLVIITHKKTMEHMCINDNHRARNKYFPMLIDIEQI